MGEKLCPFYAPDDILGCVLVNFPAMGDGLDPFARLMEHRVVIVVAYHAVTLCF